MTKAKAEKKSAGYAEIAGKVLEKFPDFKRGEVEEMVKATFEATAQMCDEGEKVKIIRFGVFTKKIRPAGQARDPKRGTIVDVVEKRGLHFKPSPGVFS